MEKPYFICFHPQFFEKIWGGNSLHNFQGLEQAPTSNCGEAWMLSGVEGKESLIFNGPLQGQSISAILGEHAEHWLGKKFKGITAKDFPVLLKLLDAADDLSVQVHPNDAKAMASHNTLGKSECWYILDSSDGYLYFGFKKDMTAEQVKEAAQNGSLTSKLAKVNVEPHDTFSVPAGLVHAIGKGVILAEIQQTSDITYRLFDFNRKDNNGNLRELHLDESISVMNSSSYQKPKQSGLKTAEFAKFDSFSCKKWISEVDLLDFDIKDSFQIFWNLGGDVSLEHNGEEIELPVNYPVLIPANTGKISLTCVDSILIQIQF